MYISPFHTVYCYRHLVLLYLRQIKRDFFPSGKGNICVSNHIAAAHFTELLLLSSQLTKVYDLAKKPADTEFGKEG